LKKILLDLFVTGLQNSVEDGFNTVGINKPFIEGAGTSL
jgi:hypothetical protein